jgi:hypothetical protein
MPNWVMNQLTCIFKTSEEYNAFKEKANIEGLYNSFIPMPEVLEGTVSPHTEPDVYIARLNSRKNTNFLNIEEVANSNDEWDSEHAKSIIKNLKAYSEVGCTNWYDWNCHNWGVKWEASECTVKLLSDFNTVIFNFNSPWGCPEQFVTSLSTLYPDAVFEMVTGSIENDNHYEFTCDNGTYKVTCSYETFKEAVMDGKWGGAREWEILFEDEQV